MSDTFAIRRYHRQTLPALGINRRRKYLRILLVLLLAGVAGTVYVVASSGILADDNPAIPSQVIGRINLERQAYGLAPVAADDRLMNLALSASREAKLSSFAYDGGTTKNAAGAASVFAIPKLSWAISGYDAQQQLFSTLMDSDPAFRASVLNGKLTAAGVGVTSDGYNYYIAVAWK